MKSFVRLLLYTVMLACAGSCAGPHTQTKGEEVSADEIVCYKIKHTGSHIPKTECIKTKDIPKRHYLDAQIQMERTQRRAAGRQ